MRLSSNFCLILLLLVLVLVPRVGETIANVAKIVSQRVIGHYKHFELLQRTDAGIDVLPPEALEVVDVARKLQLKQISLSASLRNDGSILQRITEFSWPIRVDFNALNQFWRRQEALPNNCAVQETREHLVYGICH